MTSGEVIGILPPPSYRHRQPPPQQPEQQQQPHELQRQQQHENVQNQQSQLDHPQVPENDPAPKDASLTANPGEGGVGGVELSPQQSFDLSYMHRPPAIMPNYGKRTRGSVLPKSNVSRVLLYDNITQQTMLDVRINSIRSQSYKTNRELDMHMKSFLTRRKFREKALKKITRVQHLDDYTEFIQEQELSSRHHTDPSYFPDRDVDKSGHFLPQIGSHKNNPKSRHNTKSTSPVRAQNTNKTPNGVHHVKSHSTPSTGRESLVNSLVTSTKDTTSLPYITLSSPPRDPNDQDINNERGRKVGIRLVKGDQGVTRIFNVVPEVDENAIDLERQPYDNDSTTVEALDDGDEKTNTDENNNSINASNPPDISENQTAATVTIENPYMKPRASIFQLQRMKEEEILQQQQEDKLEGMGHKPADSEIPTELHPDKPMIDSRFLHLRRLLVPQEPPNEGFAELSPSFPKRYPSLKDLSPRSRRREIEKRGRRIPRDRKEFDGFSDGDSDFRIDSSDEEEELK